MRKIILRIFGVLLGCLLCIVGISLIINPIFNSVIEKINAVTFLVMGAVFFIYGIIGKLKKG